MKTLYLFLVTAIVGFVFSIFSCNSGDYEKKVNDDEAGTYAETTENPIPGEYPYPEKPYPGEPGYPPGEEPKIIIYNMIYQTCDFTFDDIKSYNLTTKELLFTTNSFFEKLKPRIDGNDCYVYSNLILYYNDKPLFGKIPLTNPVSSIMVNDLILIMDEFKIFLADGYPIVQDDEWTKMINANNVKKERAENAEKRKEEWDIFINYLRKDGKILK